MTAVSHETSSERPRRSGLPAALGPRAQVAAGVVAGFVALLWADATGLGGTRPAWWLLPVAVLVAVRGTAEFVALFAGHDIRLRSWAVTCATAGLPVFAVVGATVGAHAGPCAAALAGLGWAAFGCAVAAGLLLAVEVARYGAEARPVERVASGMLVAVMLGLPLAFMVALRIVGGAASAGSHGGWTEVLPLVSLVVVVKGGDIAAYLVGSLIGRHAMAPRLSPGKTWEGAVASLVASIGLAWLVIEQCGGPTRPVGGAIVFGSVVGMLGMLGDLAESLVKREFGAKDSGVSLGRMGGVLDLVDSLTFAAPAAWMLWALGCMATVL